jgi:hypothetical protein
LAKARLGGSIKVEDSALLANKHSTTLCAGLQRVQEVFTWDSKAVGEGVKRDGGVASVERERKKLG